MSSNPPQKRLKEYALHLLNNRDEISPDSYLSVLPADVLNTIKSCISTLRTTRCTICDQDLPELPAGMFYLNNTCHTCLGLIRSGISKAFEPSGISELGEKIQKKYPSMEARANVKKYVNSYVRYHTCGKATEYLKDRQVGIERKKSTGKCAKRSRRK